MNANICRCCLTKNCSNKMNEEYCLNLPGETEIYENILRETFDIILYQHKTTQKYICKGCVVKLHDATIFKQQVLRSEEAFLALIHHQESSSHLGSVKQEIPDDDTNEKSVVADDVINNGCLIKDKQVPHRRKIGDTVPNDAKKPMLKANRKCLKKQSPNTIQKENTLKLIKNSNMCLFKSFKTKFGCYQCGERFLNILDLREHSRRHTDTRKTETGVTNLKGVSCLNAEISDLKCELCSKDLKGLAQLQTHLIEAHDIKFESAKHYLVPYEIQNGFRCTICGQKFESFLRLHIHMNSHSSNNVCEVCGVSYVNRTSLRVHVQGQHREKKCPQCPMVFPGNSARSAHLHKVHAKKPYLRRCLHCDKTFPYAYQLNEHCVSEHGRKRESHCCQECGKLFLTRQNLRIHTKSVHVRERKHGCAACDMRFFTKFDLSRHEATHEDVRPFSCANCETKFKNKESLRRHIKRQHSM